MDLELVSSETAELKEQALLLVRQYDEIKSSLDKISNALKETDAPIKSKVDSLISEYSEKINKINDNFLSDSDEILKYVDNTNQNLKEFCQNIKITTKIFNEMLESFEI